MALLIAIGDVSADSELIKSARGLSAAVGWQILGVNVSEGEEAVRCDSAVDMDCLSLAGQPRADLLKLVTQAEADCVALSQRLLGASALGDLAGALLTDCGAPLLLAKNGMRSITRLQRLLVPLEGTPSTCAAIDFADERLCREGCEIVMLKVAGSTLPTETGSMAARIIDQEQYAWSEWQEEFRMRFSRRGEEYPHRVIVRAGEPTAVIAEEASTIGADLIVLCSSGRCGRIARGLLEIAPCPLLIVPEQSEAHPLPA